MRQTGGRSFGATSTKSSPTSRARRSASSTGMIPNCAPSSPITRTGEMRICSLTRVVIFWSAGRFEKRSIAICKPFPNRNSVRRSCVPFRRPRLLGFIPKLPEGSVACSRPNNLFGGRKRRPSKWDCPQGKPLVSAVTRPGVNKTFSSFSRPKRPCFALEGKQGMKLVVGASLLVPAG